MNAIKKEKNVNEKYEKTIGNYEYSELIIFSIVIIVGILYSLFLDYWIRGYEGVDFLLYYTHLSNIMILVYVLSFLIFRKTNKIIIIALPAILITGLTYMIFMFPCLFVTWSIWMFFPEWGNELFDSYPYGNNDFGANISSTLYWFLAISNTLILHFVVPLFSYLLLSKHYKKENNKLNGQLGFVVTISWFVIYFLLIQISLFFSLDGTTPGVFDTESNPGHAPYFFIDLRWMEFERVTKMYEQILLYVADLVIYVIAFVFAYYLNIFLNKSKKSEDNFNFLS